MNNNTTFTNVLLVIVLVLIVGFGVWFFTKGSGPMPAPQNSQGGIDVNIEGALPGTNGGNSGTGSGGGASTDDDGTPDQGPGDN